MNSLKARGLSVSLARRLSKGDQGSFGNSSYRQTGRINNTGSNRKTGIQSRIGIGIPAQKRNRDSVHNRINSGVSAARHKQPTRVHQRSLMLLEKEILSISSSSLPRRNRIQSRNDRESALEGVRINNGAIVKGLRSDQMMLERHRSHQEKRPSHYSRDRPTIRRSLRRSPERFEPSFRRQGSVSLNFNTGLKVSFSNDTARSRKPLSSRRAPPPHPSTVKRSRPRPNSSSASSSEEDSAMSSSEEEAVAAPVAPPAEPRMNPAEQAELRELLRIGTERPAPPKLHKQILDPQVQREIAVLQGRDDKDGAEATATKAGPGLKNFKMMPSRTKTSLTSRFTIEKSS